jgi:hypothetical protein
MQRKLTTFSKHVERMETGFDKQVCAFTNMAVHVADLLVKNIMNDVIKKHILKDFFTVEW